MLRVLHPEPLGLPGALLFGLAASFSVLSFPWLAYHGIERPGRTFVQRAFARPAAPAIAPPALRRP